MKANNLFFLIVVFILSGCYMGALTYDTFEKQRNVIIKDKIPMNGLLSKYYTKQDYNEKEYIYIKSNDPVHHHSGLAEECMYGFITEKDDPKQIAIRWEILSGKEYCKEQQGYTFSF